MAQNPMQPHANLGAYGTGFNPQIQHYGHTPQQPYQHNLYPQQQQMSQNMNPQLFAGQTNNPQMFHQHGPLPDQVPQAVSIGQTGQVQVPFQQQHIGKVPTPAPAAQQPVETPEERRRREEKEEQRRREAEITKRKLKSINVSKPVAGGDTPLSLESLIGFTPETIAKPKQKPPGSSTDSKKVTVEEAPPSAAATVERVGQPVAAVTAPPKDTPPSAPTTSIPGLALISIYMYCTCMFMPLYESHVHWWIVLVITTLKYSMTVNVAVSDTCEVRIKLYHFWVTECEC